MKNSAKNWTVILKISSNWDFGTPLTTEWSFLLRMRVHSSLWASCTTYGLWSTTQVGLKMNFLYSPLSVLFCFNFKTFAEEECGRRCSRYENLVKLFEFVLELRTGYLKILWYDPELLGASGFSELAKFLLDEN